MATLTWGAAILLTVAGALLFWSAPLMAVESFYADAGILLFLALFLAGLAHV